MTILIILDNVINISYRNATLWEYELVWKHDASVCVYVFVIKVCNSEWAIVKYFKKILYIKTIKHLKI